MTTNNKSERNYRGKRLGWPVTSYGAAWSFSFLCLCPLGLATKINYMQSGLFNLHFLYMQCEIKTSLRASLHLVFRILSVPHHDN